MARISMSELDEAMQKLQSACRGLLGHKLKKQAQFRTEQMRREQACKAILEGWRRFAPRRAALRVERQKTTIAQNESYFDSMRNQLEDAAVRQIQRWWRGARVRLRNYRWRVVSKQN